MLSWLAPLLLSAEEQYKAGQLWQSSIHQLIGNLHPSYLTKIDDERRFEITEQPTDLIKPFRVSYANQILKGKQLCHLSGRILPNSLQNELALADLC